jgi:hypothetical protein
MELVNILNCNTTHSFLIGPTHFVLLNLIIPTKTGKDYKLLVSQLAPGIYAIWIFSLPNPSSTLFPQRGRTGSTPIWNTHTQTHPLHPAVYPSDEWDFSHTSLSTTTCIGANMWDYCGIQTRRRMGERRLLATRCRSKNPWCQTYASTRLS